MLFLYQLRKENNLHWQVILLVIDKDWTWNFVQQKNNHNKNLLT